MPWRIGIKSGTFSTSTLTFEGGIAPLQPPIDEGGG